MLSWPDWMQGKSGTNMHIGPWSQCLKLCTHWSCDNLTASAWAGILRHHQPFSLWAQLWQVPWSFSHLLKLSLEWCSEGWKNTRRSVGVDKDVAVSTAARESFSPKCSLAGDVQSTRTWIKICELLAVLGVLESCMLLSVVCTWLYALKGFNSVKIHSVEPLKLSLQWPFPATRSFRSPVCHPPWHMTFIYFSKVTFETGSCFHRTSEEVFV